MVYLIFAVIWLVVSFSQWRDLLRIQFWIGAVILIGKSQPIPTNSFIRTKF